MNAFSRRRCGCGRLLPDTRRRSTKLLFVVLLFVFCTLTTLYKSPSSGNGHQGPDDADLPASSSVVLRQPRHVSDASVAMSTLLATPDCDALIAGDRAEIASTQRMLYRETRTTSTSFAAGGTASVNCTSPVQPASDNAHRPATFRPLAYIISDAGRDAEQTELLLHAVYATANVYCLTFDLCVAADWIVSSTLRRMSSCFDNIITVEQTRCADTGSADRKLTVWWLCLEKLLRHGVDWTHMVSLTVGDLPLRPQLDISRRLTTAADFVVGRRTGSDVINCGAYARSAVIQLPTRLRRRSRESERPGNHSSSHMHSPDVASAIEVCTRKCPTADDVDANSNSRCSYTVADLSSLVRQRLLFAHAFDLSVDHYAVQCLVQRIVQ